MMVGIDPLERHSVVLGTAEGPDLVLDGSEDGFDLRHEVAIDGLGDPGDVFFDLVGVGGPYEGGMDLGIGERKLQSKPSELGSVIATRFLQKLLFGVSPWDPSTIAGIVALLTLASLVASFIPARRAASVDAMEALRLE